jgi:exopolysaccharide biosynthesis polyprenyl glycosylphosphotransferase
MKRADLLFAFLLVPTDLLAIFLAFASAYLLRANVEIPPVTYLWPMADYLEFIAATLPAWVLTFALGGMYEVANLRLGSGEWRRIFVSVSAGIALVVFGIFFTRTTFFSRLIILYAYVLAIFFVFLGRSLLRQLQRYLFRFGTGVYRLMIIGAGELTENVIKEIQQHPNLGYRLVHIATKKDLTRVKKLIHEHQVDEILIADSSLTSPQLLSLVELCEEERIGLKQIPNLFEVKAAHVNIGALAGIPLVEFKKTRLEGWVRIVKRIFDVMASFLLLILFAPLLILIAILIKLDSPGPVIYKNRRVGPDGLFTAYKFRSMYVEYSTGEEYGGKAAEEFENKLVAEMNARQGPIFKIKGDPRRTKIGRILERTSLDELPQLFNVLKGEMSLIGPRPHMPKEVIHYEKAYKKLLHVKPGVTGLAQISGRSDLSTEEEVRLDTYYVENWSPIMDVMILFKTPLALIRRRRTES